MTRINVMMSCTAPYYLSLFAYVVVATDTTLHHALNATFSLQSKPGMPQEQTAPIYRTPVFGSAWSISSGRVGSILGRDASCECFDPEKVCVSGPFNLLFPPRGSPGLCGARNGAFEDVPSVSDLQDKADCDIIQCVTGPGTDDFCISKDLSCCGNGSCEYEETCCAANGSCCPEGMDCTPEGGCCPIGKKCSTDPPRCLDYDTSVCKGTSPDGHCCSSGQPYCNTDTQLAQRCGEKRVSASPVILTNLPFKWPATESPSTMSLPPAVPINSVSQISGPFATFDISSADFSKEPHSLVVRPPFTATKLVTITQVLSSGTLYGFCPPLTYPGGYETSYSYICLTLPNWPYSSTIYSVDPSPMPAPELPATATNIVTTTARSTTTRTTTVVIQSTITTRCFIAKEGVPGACPPKWTSHLSSSSLSSSHSHHSSPASSSAEKPTPTNIAFPNAPPGTSVVPSLGNRVSSPYSLATDSPTLFLSTSLVLTLSLLYYFYYYNTHRSHSGNRKRSHSLLNDPIALRNAQGETIADVVKVLDNSGRRLSDVSHLGREITPVREAGRTWKEKDVKASQIEVVRESLELVGENIMKEVEE